MEPVLPRWLVVGLALLAGALTTALVSAQGIAGGALAQGQACLDAGRFEEAVGHLRTAFREDPGNPEVSFALGLAAFGAGDYEAAATAFDRVLAMRPADDRARLELARTYCQLRLFSVAQGLFEEVRAKPETPESVRRNVDRYLAEIRAARSPHRLGGALTLSLARDDNARVSPGGDIRIAGLPRFSVPVERDLFAAQTLVLEHQWRPSAEGAFWGTEVLGYDALYLDQDDLDVQYLRLDTGPRWSAGRLVLGLGVNGAFMEKDYDRYLGTAGVRAFASVAVSRQAALRLEVSGEQRRYWEVSEADGFCGTVVLRPTYRLGRHVLTADLGFEEHDADAETQSYDQAFAGIGYQLSLPWRLTFLASYLYENWLFGGHELLADDRRREAVHTATVGLRRQLCSRAAAELRQAYETSHSTGALYDYERNVTSFSLIWVF